jgi:hypothetical protein
MSKLTLEVNLIIVQEFLTKRNLAPVLYVPNNSAKEVLL